jgi:hypothetical protein
LIVSSEILVWIELKNLDLKPSDMQLKDALQGKSARLLLPGINSGKVKFKSRLWITELKAERFKPG